MNRIRAAAINPFRPWVLKALDFGTNCVNLTFIDSGGAVSEFEKSAPSEPRRQTSAVFFFLKSAPNYKSRLWLTWQWCFFLLRRAIAHLFCGSYEVFT